jgi:hypothetical protein
MSGSITSGSGTFAIGFFVNNLTDEDNPDFRFTTAPFGATNIITRPRTYGINLTFNF